MNVTDSFDRVSAGFARLLELPILGPVTQETFDTLDLGPVLPTIINTLIEKSELTSTDGQLHSRLLMFHGPADLMVVLTILTWPKTLAESRKEAMEQFFSAGPHSAAGQHFAGKAQIDAFLGGSAEPEIRLAWIPISSNVDRLPGALRRTLLPWGTEPPSVEEKLTPATGSDIVALARASGRMILAMRGLLNTWPDEDRRPSFGFSDARDQVSASAPMFNAAVKRMDLGHLMPLSKWDDTWRPHNLENSLRFNSVAASLEADLLRVWGKQARNDFAQALQRFLEVLPPPPSDDAALTGIAQRPVERHPVPSVPPSEKAVDVFISYAWADKTRGARDIYQIIQSSGRTAWLDEEQRLQEPNLNKDIESALGNADRIVICLTLEMLTRGGYALRETLLATCFHRSRCILVRLDKVPIPASLKGIPRVDWDKHGPEALLAALEMPLSDESSLTSPSNSQMLSGPCIEELVAPLRRPDIPRRNLGALNRLEALPLRAKLLRVVHSTFHEFEANNMDKVVEIAEEEPKLLPWCPFYAPACLEDAAIFGAALRLRSVLFRAHIQLGAGDNWKRHNLEAFELLETIVSLDTSMLRPAPSCGWSSNDCRLAVQDCLDVFEFSEDWFRGWSPKILVDMCDVPKQRVFRIQERITERVALLAERMLGLRAWEEAVVLPEKTLSWANAWSSLAEDLRRKLEIGAHPHTKAYFEKLSSYLTGEILDQIATVLSDGTIESALGKEYREELFFDLGPFRLRSIVRCYCSRKNKRESLSSVRGTVLRDLRGPGSNQADLNILFSLFSRPPDGQRSWECGLFMNISPSESYRRDRLPAILTAQFLLAEMLSDSERESGAVLGAEIYEEL